jgi:uncharacterized protein YcbX
MPITEDRSRNRREGAAAMFVKEIWRYPVKSMAGERIAQAEVGELGISVDRTILVHVGGRLVTSRTHHRLLGLKGTLDSNGVPQVSGHTWNSPEALELVKEVAGPDAELVHYEGKERFDVLPLLVATDGAINHMGFDGRRLRPNIVIGGVEGLLEREWPGSRLQIGGILIHAAQLRGRCVMTTLDPDTLEQDRAVLTRIVRELNGKMALDCAVLQGGLIREGDPVFLLEG